MRFSLSRDRRRRRRRPAAKPVSLVCCMGQGGVDRISFFFIAVSTTMVVRVSRIPAGVVSNWRFMPVFPQFWSFLAYELHRRGCGGIVIAIVNIIIGTIEQ